MRAHVLAFCLGALVLRFLPAVPPNQVLLVFGLTALLLLRVRRTAGYCLAAALLGLCWSSWQAGNVLEQRLDPAWDGETLWLEGRVTGLPQWQVDADWRVVRFELQDATSRRTALPSRLRLSWHDPPLLRAGERWRLAVRLKRPDGLLNPHGFDYLQWLTARKIGATGTVKTGQRLSVGVGVSAWREQLRERLYSLLPDSPALGGVLALSLGDGSVLTSEQWQLLQDSGTVHLFVISGQHVSLVAGLGYGLVALLARLGLWPARLPWLPAACLLALAGAYTYGALAGFAVPVQRALIMGTVVLLWRMGYRPLSDWKPWLLALATVLVLDPMVILQAGFWLSFSAVACLLLVFAARLGRWQWWQVLWRAQWAAAAGLLPLLLATGLPVSWVGPLANLVAVPFVSFLLLPLVLLGLLLSGWPLVGGLMLQLADLSLQALWWWLAWLVQGWPAWQGAVPGIWVLLATALAVLLLLLPAALRPLWLPLLLLVPLLWPPGYSTVPAGQARIWMLDVGQGQAIVVQTAAHALLYDAGPAMGGQDAGETVVAPFLRGERIRHLDRLILSHADADHAGGAGAVMRRVTVGRLISGEAQRHRQLKAESCKNDSWEWDGVRFRQWQWQGATDGNAASCVLLIDAGGERFLVTGDLDVPGERALLEAWPDLQVDWLVAGHHGSRTSTAQFWLQQLRPHSVLVSRGKHNSYGHPHPLVLSRIQHNNMRLYDTAHDKAMRIDLGARQPLWSMASERRFWRDPPQKFDVVAR